MNNLINLREDFISNIKSALYNYGFKEEGENYLKNIQFRTPGQVMIINGQRMEHPGEIIETVYKVNIIGDGWVSNTDGVDKEEFTQIGFEIYQNQEKIWGEEFCFYWDNPNNFNIILNQVLNLIK